MPQVKKYQSNAERQKAYNLRNRNNKTVTFIALLKMFEGEPWSMSDGELMELNTLAQLLETGTHTMIANRKQARNFYDESFIRSKEQLAFLDRKLKSL